jgi:hypothetical protein
MPPICEPHTFRRLLSTSEATSTLGVSAVAGSPSTTSSPPVRSIFTDMTASYFAGIVLRTTRKLFSSPLSSSALVTFTYLAAPMLSAPRRLSSVMSNTVTFALSATAYWRAVCPSPPNPATATGSPSLMRVNSIGE